MQIKWKPHECRKYKVCSVSICCQHKAKITMSFIAEWKQRGCETKEKKCQNESNVVNK